MNRAIICVGHPMPVVQPEGNVVIVFIDECANYKRRAFISSDGGAKFSSDPSTSRAGDGHFPGGGCQNPGRCLRRRRRRPAPSTPRGPTAISGLPETSGQKCGTHNDIAFSTSQDGRHWTEVVRIPIDPVTSSVDHFCRPSRSTPRPRVHRRTSGSSTTSIRSRSAVGGPVSPRWGSSRPPTVAQRGGPTARWAVQEHVVPADTGGYMVGEYIGDSFVNGKAVRSSPSPLGGDAGSVTLRRATCGRPPRRSRWDEREPSFPMPSSVVADGAGGVVGSPPGGWRSRRSS